MRALVPLLLVFLLTLPVPARGGRKAEPPPAPDPTRVDLARLQELAAEVVPLVEAVTGRRFTRVPFVGLGTRETLQRVVRDESLLVLRRLYQAPEPVLRELADSWSHATDGTLGKFTVYGYRLYIATDSVQPALAEADLGPERTGDFLRLVLAHELAHALQDQEAPARERLAQVHHTDAFEAWRAVTEGHATRVTEQVAERLGLTDLFWASVALQGWGPDGLEVPSAWATWSAYGLGHRFVRWHEEQGGIEQVWRVVRDPPERTALILHPERWEQPVPQVEGPRLEGLEKMLASVPWVVTEGPLGELPLRAELLGADEAAVDAALARWSGGWRREASAGDRGAEIWVLDFEDAAAAAAWLELLRAQAPAQATRLSVPGSPLAVTVESRTLDGGITALERVVAPAGPHPAALESRSTWTVRDDLVLAVRADAFRPGLRADRTLEALGDRIADWRGAAHEVAP